MATNTQCYFQFEDDVLQRALIERLARAGVAYAPRVDGAIVFGEANSAGIMDEICRIRDAQFPWYLVKWPTDTESTRYRDALTAAGLPFVVEHQETGIWFVVRRGDRAKHDLLREQVFSEY